MNSTALSGCGHIGQWPQVEVPFSRVLALEYYDGPTAGLLECATCATPYRFELLEWDVDQDQRAFSLAPVSVADFRMLIDVLSETVSPRWPVWAPRWQFETQQTKQHVEALTAAVLASAGQPIAAIATPNFLQVDAAVMLPREGMHGISDWFSFLGV